MFTCADVQALFEQEDGEPDGFNIVQESEWEQNGKYQERVVVYSVVIAGVAQYFQVTEVRYGSPWTDWDYEAPHFTEVVPKEVTTTIYVAK